jgi:hypothetical protein
MLDNLAHRYIRIVQPAKESYCRRGHSALGVQTPVAYEEEQAGRWSIERRPTCPPQRVHSKSGVKIWKPIDNRTFPHDRGVLPPGNLRPRSGVHPFGGKSANSTKLSKRLVPHCQAAWSTGSYRRWSSSTTSTCIMQRSWEKDRGWLANEKVSGEIGLTPKGHGDAGDWKDSRSSWDVDTR